MPLLFYLTCEEQRTQGMSKKTALVQWLQSQRCATKPLDTFGPKSNTGLHNMRPHLGFKKEEGENH